MGLSCRFLITGYVGTQTARLRDQSARFLPETSNILPDYFSSPKEREEKVSFVEAPVRTVGKPPLDSDKIIAPQTESADE